MSRKYKRATRHACVELGCDGHDAPCLAGARSPGSELSYRIDDRHQYQPQELVLSTRKRSLQDEGVEPKSSALLRSSPSSRWAKKKVLHPAAYCAGATSVAPRPLAFALTTAAHSASFTLFDSRRQLETTTATATVIVEPARMADPLMTHTVRD